MAAVVGGITGALVLGGFVGLGLILDDRVASIVPVIVLSVAGAYAAWLVGVIVFGAVRGGPDGQEGGA
ncbi:MAG TPA: hypothetical protein VGV88_08335 [Candidatus Dormibacteraeota bacterium]|nr:hypothetical protein [Candidatus Dormibacteraeota bacterium]